MTREEAIKFLSNTKVYVQGKSKGVQEKLFSLGFGWKCRDKQVSFTEKPFLFIWADREICYRDNMIIFTNNTFREISVDDILNIVIDEPKYRPFKNTEECWNEMLKHHPFGWTKGSNNGCLYNIRAMSGSSITIGSYSCEFSVALDCYTFVDGTPFGIKEE